MESVFKENSISMDGLIEPGPFCGYMETQQRLAQVLNRMNRPYAAERCLGECSSAVTAIVAERPNSLRYNVAHANTWMLVAELLADRRSKDAETAYHEAKKLWTEINETFPHGRQHPIQQDVSASLYGGAVPAHRMARALSHDPHLHHHEAKNAGRLIAAGAHGAAPRHLTSAPRRTK